MKFEEIFKQFIQDDNNESFAFDTFSPFEKFRIKQKSPKGGSKQLKPTKKKGFGFYNNFYEDRFYHDDIDEHFKDFFSNEEKESNTEKTIDTDVDMKDNDAQEPKEYHRSYSSVSRRYNDVEMKKEKMVDSRKGSKEVFKRQKGDKMVKIVKSKDVEGKEDVKKFFENVEDEKQFDEEWKIMEPNKPTMKMLM